MLLPCLELTLSQLNQSAFRIEPEIAFEVEDKVADIATGQSPLVIEDADLAIAYLDQTERSGGEYVPFFRPRQLLNSCIRTAVQRISYEFSIVKVVDIPIVESEPKSSP